MVEIRDLVFDCPHPASLARFWAAVLEGYEVAPYDEAELARLRSKGIEDPEDDPMVVVEAGPGTLPRLLFQLMPAPTTVQNRVHLGLTCTDLAAETDRLVALGAAVLARHDGWVALADPAGHEFRLTPRT